MILQMLQPIKANHKMSWVPSVTLVLGLSLLYTLCSQLSLRLPCLPVPVRLQPAPLFLAALLLGWPAIHAYVLYMTQGLFGLPVFAGWQGGLMRLLGPTGGYLVGFLIGMILLALLRRHCKKSTPMLLASYYTAALITFACGLLRLSHFVDPGSLFAAGVWPFIIGDFIIKPLLVIYALRSFDTLRAYFKHC